MHKHIYHLGVISRIFYKLLKINTFQTKLHQKDTANVGLTKKVNAWYEKRFDIIVYSKGQH
jgi:hypothetical protein